MRSNSRTGLQLEVLESRTLLSGAGALPVLPNFPNLPSFGQLVGDLGKVAVDVASLGADTAVLTGASETAPLVLTLVSAARNGNSLAADLADHNIGQAFIDFGGVFGSAASVVISDFTTLLQDGAQIARDVQAIFGVSQPSRPTPPPSTQPVTPPVVQPPSQPALPPGLGPLVTRGGLTGYDPDGEGDIDVTAEGDPTDGDGVAFKFRTEPGTVG
jgi:hypothetical protein